MIALFQDFYFHSPNPLYEIIEQREDVSSAVLFGANCGAFTCQKKGAFTALPRLTDIEYST